MKTQNSLSQKTADVSTGEIFKEERSFLAEGYDFVVGIDEAGRGPLAGPVTAAAVAWRNIQYPILNIQSNPNNQEFFKNINLIKDSKKLSEKQREALYDFIQDNFYVGVGICDHSTIDRVNILEATYLAMKSAIAALNSKIQMSNDKSNPNFKFQNFKKIILVDGNKIIPNLSIEQRAIVGGDGFVKSIAAASIIAKVTRDRMMREAHSKYPQYNFLQHKGYGTKIHMDALKKFGPCEIHRRSFRPVRDAIDMYRMMISN
ncbi:MAG: ribonuclease HII [Parcubacteria group bacterium]